MTPVSVDVRNGNLEVTTRQHVDLIAHVFNRSSDRELLKDVATRLGSVERGGA